MVWGAGGEEAPPVGGQPVGGHQQRLEHAVDVHVPALDVLHHAAGRAAEHVLGAARSGELRFPRQVDDAAAVATPQASTRGARG